MDSNKFPVYIIKSSWSLLRIDEFLKEYEEVEFLRIIHNKDGTETNKTLAVLKDDTYKKLCDKGYGNMEINQSTSIERGFYIYPFILATADLPAKNSGKTLFIPVPNQLENDDIFVSSTVTDKLNHISELDIIPINSWETMIPLKSREKGGIKSGCFILFDAHITTNQIAMVKVLLSDTYWPERNEEEDRLLFRCVWAREKKVFVPTKVLSRTLLLNLEQPMLR